MEKVYLLTEAQLKALVTATLDEYRKFNPVNEFGMEEEEYLSSKQVCKELNVCARTFQRYRV